MEACVAERMHAGEGCRRKRGSLIPVLSLVSFHFFWNDEGECVEACRAYVRCIMYAKVPYVPYHTPNYPIRIEDMILYEVVMSVEEEKGAESDR